MKAPALIKVIILSISVLAFSNFLQAQVTYGAKQAKMTVAGTSTLHEWVSDVNQVECKGSFTVQGNQLSEVKDVTVKIPVTGIKSTKGKIMDNKTYEAFNYEKNPFIQFKLTSSKIAGSEPEFTVTSTGSLTMAGVAKPLELTVKATVLANGDVQITGAKKLNLKNHNMTPPTAMMGTIKVGEEVTVVFDITLTKK